MTPEELIRKLKISSEARTKIDQEWETLRDDLERQVMERIKNIPGLYALLSVTYKDVHLYIYSYNDVKIMEGGGWGMEDPEDEYGYGLPVEHGPISWADFELLVQGLGNELGIKPEYSKLKRRIEGSIQNIVTLKLLYPNKTITLLEEGKIEYKGWEIPNTYYVAKLDDEVWAYWSEDAHGGEITRSALQNTSEWKCFEIFKEG
jgi:hypothetical protein